MSEVFDPEQVERWDCQAGGFLDGGTVAVMVGAGDGEYVYAWQYLKLLALYRELQRQMIQGMNDSRAASLGSYKQVPSITVYGSSDGSGRVR